MNQTIKREDNSFSEEVTTEEYEAIRLIKSGVRMLVNIITRDIIQEVLRQIDVDPDEIGQIQPTGDLKSPEQSEKLTYSVPEVAKLLGLSRQSVYEAVKIKQIPSISFGKRIIIRRAALEKMLSGVDINYK